MSPGYRARDVWIIAGLGNPGRKYRKTRHNIGFAVADRLAEQCSLPFADEDFFSAAVGTWGDAPLVILKPLTFMNVSGEAVREAVRIYRCRPERLIVVHDDLDLPVGKIRIRKKGSSGGHRGVQSIIECIGTNEFVHLKIGIGRPVDLAPEEYVLRKFSSDERKTVDEAVKAAADAIVDILEHGLSSAMNRYNRPD